MSFFQKFRKNVETLSPNSYRFKPRRLQNHGNTCYLNATIQVLAQCQLITDWVRQNPTRDMAFENPSGQTLFGWRILRLLEDLIGEHKSPFGLRNRMKSIFSFPKKNRDREKKENGPSERKKECSEQSSRHGSSSHEGGTDATKEAILCLQREKVSPLINGTDQQDSHKFLRLMYICINAAYESQVPRGIFKRRRYPFLTLVKGQGIRRTRCLTCGNFTDSVEYFKDISIPISIDAHMLDCLQKVFEAVHLQGEDSYDCSHCGKKKPARQEIHITHLPPVLTFHLQRGAFDGQRAFKVMSRIHIPVTMTLRSSNPEEPRETPQKYKYTLFGVVSHVGHHVSSGHYVSYVRTKDGEWFKCDDMTITPVTNAEFKKDVLFPITRTAETPYLLFYDGEDRL